MKDNITETILFSQEIEKYPQLYDHNLSEYSNRRTTELTWARIGEKFHETGDTCKSKWKGIRSAYIRSLSTKGKSGSSAGSKKPYYLGQYLKFLNAFRKNYPQEGNLLSPPSNQEPENLIGESQISNEETGTHEADSQNSDPRETRFSADFDDVGESQYAFPSDTPTAGPSTADSNDQQTDISSPGNLASPALPIKLTGKRDKTTSYRTKGLNAVDKCAIDYFNAKNKKTETIPSSPQLKQSHCELFLLSLVPQMESMTPRQQLSFQKGVLQLIENIQYPLESVPEQRVLATAAACSYYNSFEARNKEQQITYLQDLTPAQSSYEHTPSQQTTHLQDLTSAHSSSHTYSQC